MVPDKVSSYTETKRSAQLTAIIQRSLLSYAMIGDCTLEPLTYGVHHRGLQLVEIVEYPLAKYMEKYRAHWTGLIKL